MIIKQTSIELTLKDGHPIKFLQRGIEQPVKDAIKLYRLDKPHYADGNIYGKPFTDLNAILSAGELEKQDERLFKITEILDAPKVEWVEGRIY